MGNLDICHQKTLGPHSRRSRPRRGLRRFSTSTATRDTRPRTTTRSGRLIFDLFPNRFEQLAEFIRRLVVNILVGNGDAHLKNWWVSYRDKVTPRLSPAYDLVSTIQYVQNDSLALNLGGEKRFESID